MKTVIVSPALRFEIYESIKAMPARLYQIARQYEVMATELGQSNQELDAMLGRAENYAVAGQMDSFKEQLNNYRLARLVVKDGFQAGQLDWACHVYSVNDKPITDYSEEALLARIADWSALGLTQELIEESFDAVKKNGKPN